MSKHSASELTGLSSLELLPVVYDELRRLARARMSGEPRDHTLQATALVHEAFLRLTDRSSCSDWQTRGHFIAAVSEAMRRILVERARRKQTQKRGGNWNRMPSDLLGLVAESMPVDILALDDALNVLETIHPLKARLVLLRFFAGTTLEEAAEILGISPSTADNYWAFARSWLRVEMAESGSTPPTEMRSF